MGHLLRSAAVLGAGRQVGSLALMGTVLVLPAVAERGVVDDFIWAYFASLFLSSILNLGLERVVAPTVARSGGAMLRSVLQPVLCVRLYTFPVSMAALWALYRFVDVRLPMAAWAFSLAWVLAIQVQGVAFAGLRAVARYRFEPATALVSRLVEAAAVLALAAAGASVTALIGAVACVEVAVALVAVRGLGKEDECAPSTVRHPALPWRTISVYALVELLAFAYLRVDMALVGHILGPGPGATYGLVYRVIDALTGLATPVLLILFPFAARAVAVGDGLLALRDRALRLLPGAAVVLSVAAVFFAALLAEAVPRFGEGLSALRILLIAVPLYFLSAIELHLRSAENRNAGVLTIGALVLMLNVALNIVLLPRYGLNGAAWAVCLSEAVQVVAIMFSGGPGQAVVRRRGAAVLGYAAGLVVVAVLMDQGRVVPGALTGLALIIVAGTSSFRSAVPSAPVPA